MFKNWAATLAAVKAALMRRGRSAEDAEDLVQESWLRMATSPHDMPAPEQAAYLMRTALNLAIDMHRVRALRGEEVEVDNETLVDGRADTEAEVLARERIERLAVCMARLSDKTRDIFTDILIHGASHAEVAQRHGVSVGTVEKHVAKATMLMAHWMQGW